VTWVLFFFVQMVNKGKQTEFFVTGLIISSKTFFFRQVV